MSQETNDKAEKEGQAAMKRVFPNLADWQVEEEERDTAKMAMPCQVMSRVVGYLTAIGGWNKGKRQEERDRVYYK